MNTKFLAVALAAVAGAAFADSTSVTTDYVLGVLPVEMKENQSEIILNIPWIEPGSSGEGVAVTNLIKTSSLSEGDTLRWYDGTEYQAWRVSSTGYWVPYQMASAGGVNYAAAATATELQRGQALVLTRGSTAVTNIYVVGQYTNSTVTTTIAGGSYTAPKYTLIAPPAVTNVNLKAYLSTISPVSGDQVSFMKDGVFKTYSYNGSAWGTTTVVQTGGKPFPQITFDAASDDQMTIPKGTGLYYKRNSTAASVTW